jgi:hypothetical protein
MFRMTRPTHDYRKEITKAWFESFQSHHEDVNKTRRVSQLTKLAPRERIQECNTWQSSPTLIDAWAE